MNKPLPILQIARGCAALIVVFHHIAASEFYYFKYTPFAGIFDVGYNAVDFFFALSGFIIYYIHGSDLGQPSRWKSYIRKRLVRIYPLYWVVALLALLLLFIGTNQLGRGELSDALHSPSYLLKSLLLIPQNRFPFLGVSWSLCYEMFFYILFSLGILTNKKVLWIFPLVYVGINTWKLMGHYTGNSLAVSFLSAHYHLEFMLGIVAAWCYRMTQAQETKGMKSNPSFRWLWIIGLVLFAATWYEAIVSPGVFGKFDLSTKLSYGVASALIIFSVAQWRQIKDTRFNRFFILSGDASYSLYLTHVLVLALLFKLITRVGIHGKFPWLNYGIFLLMAGFCLVAGIIVHKKVEKPLLSLLNRKAPVKNSLSQGAPANP